MVKVEFVDGTEESVEVVANSYAPYNYISIEESYIVHGISGDIHYPREFVKSIRYIEI